MDHELMTVEQAAEAYDVSASTLRRRVQFGEVPGAVKLRGRRGPEWRVPPAALERLGYRRSQVPDPELADLVMVVRRLTDLVHQVQRENAQLNRALGGAVATAAELRRQLDDERELRGSASRSSDEVGMRRSASGR